MQDHDLSAAVCDDITAHALRDYPREACGLVVIAKGRQRYRPCPNTDGDGRQGFRIAAEDWAAAEDAGEIIAVVHSHPDAPARPSEHDRVVCETLGLPWYIVSVRGLDDGSQHEWEFPWVAEWGSIAPSGYAAPLVGRQYSWGVLDCYSLIRDWYQRERGITLPDFDREFEFWKRGLNTYVDNIAAAGFRPLGAHEDWAAGDVFLCRMRSDVPNHGGLYIGDGMVLHHMMGRLSSRDVWGGYLADTCTHRLRYAGPA